MNVTAGMNGTTANVVCRAALLGVVESFPVPVELVEEPMEDRRQNQGDHGQEDHAAVQGVETSKQLSSWGPQWVYRPLATQEHRRVKKSIAPAEALEIRVPGHSEY